MSPVRDPGTQQSARAVAEAVLDPELPMLTLAELGVLRDVREEPGGRVVVTLTPTYSGCPALATMRADLLLALRRAGYADVRIDVALSPAWSSDWISETGRATLAAHHIVPPTPTTLVALHLTEPPCPQCGAAETRELSRFGSTACRALHVCSSCGEPFDRIKTI